MSVVWHPTVRPRLFEGKESHPIFGGLQDRIPVDLADVLWYITGIPAKTTLTLHNVELTDILGSDAIKEPPFCLERLFLYEVIPFGTQPEFLRARLPLAL